MSSSTRGAEVVEAEVLDEDRQQHHDGRGRRRHADEVVGLPFRLLLVERDVEAGEPQRGGQREDHHADPAEALQAAKAPVEDEERRRHAEVDEIGEAVELGAEAGGRLQQARDAAVDAVEQGREHDGTERQLVAPLDPHADRGEPGAQASSVKKFGTSMRTGTWRWRNSGMPPAPARLFLKPRYDRVHGQASSGRCLAGIV